MKREDLPLPEVDLGTLSRSEERLARHVTTELSPSEAFLKERLEDQKYEATESRRFFEAQLKRQLPRNFPFDVIQSYADWTAREALTRDALERMGWL